MDRDRNPEESVQPQEVERRMDDAPVEREGMAGAVSRQPDGDDGVEREAVPRTDGGAAREGSSEGRVSTEDVERERMSASPTAGDGAMEGGYGYDRPSESGGRTETSGDREMRDNPARDW